MISNHSLGLIVNVFLHMLILLIFLTILFFTVIAKKEKDELNSQIKGSINSGISILFDNIPQKAKAHINWKDISTYMKTLEKQYDHSDKSVEQNNKNILNNTIILISMLFIIVSFYMVYISVIKKIQIGVKNILIENICIFIILGSLEFVFFWFIIQKYIPIFPEDAEIELLEHIKSYF